MYGRLVGQLSPLRLSNCSQACHEGERACTFTSHKDQASPPQQPSNAGNACFLLSAHICELLQLLWRVFIFYKINYSYLSSHYLNNYWQTEMGCQHPSSPAMRESVRMDKYFQGRKFLNILKMWTGKYCPTFLTKTWLLKLCSILLSWISLLPNCVASFEIFGANFALISTFRGNRKYSGFLIWNHFGFIWSIFSPNFCFFSGLEAAFTAI